MIIDTHYTHQLVKPIDHSKGRLVQVFPWSETLGVLWHKKEKEHLIAINIFCQQSLLPAFIQLVFQPLVAKKSAFLEEGIELTFIELNSDNNPFLIIGIRG